MKFIVKAIRKQGDVWRGELDRKQITACPSDVVVLFTMGRGNEATFEISNGRPRGHEDYHVFEYMGSVYRVVETTPGYKPYMTSVTSARIRKSFLDKKQKADLIYVSVL
jgi:hypothetical protein